MRSVSFDICLDDGAQVRRVGVRMEWRGGREERTSGAWVSPAGKRQRIEFTRIYFFEGEDTKSQSLAWGGMRIDIQDSLYS